MEFKNSIKNKIIKIITISKFISWRIFNKKFPNKLPIKNPRKINNKLKDKFFSILKNLKAIHGRIFKMLIAYFRWKKYENRTGNKNF